MPNANKVPEPFNFYVDEMTQVIVDRMNPAAHAELDYRLLQAYQKWMSRESRLKCIWNFDEKELEVWNLPSRFELSFKKAAKDGICMTVNAYIGDRISWKKSALYIEDAKVSLTAADSLVGRKIEEVAAGTPYGHLEIIAIGKSQKSNPELILRTKPSKIFRLLTINGQTWSLRRSIHK